MTHDDYFSMQEGWIVKVISGGIYNNEHIRLDKMDTTVWYGTVVVSNKPNRIGSNWGPLSSPEYYEIVRRGEAETRYNKLRGLYEVT